MSDSRLERNVRFFGSDGQCRLREASCAVVGVGGLGTHVVQQLSLLGVGGLRLVDGELLDETNLNRYVGVGPGDVGERKVDLGERLARGIDPRIRVDVVFDSFVSDAGFEAVREANYVLGCLDSEGARLILTELCSAYSRPYFDLASDILDEERLRYGGRVCAAVDGQGCLCCLGVLDQSAAGADLESASARRDRETIYGVGHDSLDRAGPSVVSINGVVASLAVTEFMVLATGLRAPKRLMTYYGNMGKVTVSAEAAGADCWYCQSIRGAGARADVERHIRSAADE